MPLDSAWAGSTDDHGATTLSDTHRRKSDAVCDETSARHADIDDPYAMLTEDTRGREQEFTLDRKGFTLIKAPTSIHNLPPRESIAAPWCSSRAAPDRRPASHQARRQHQPLCWTHHLQHHTCPLGSLLCRCHNRPNAGC
jgi:hypothetical protein